LHPEESANCVGKICILFEMFSRNLKSELWKRKKFFDRIDFDSLSFSLFYSWKIGDFSFSNNDFFLIGDLEFFRIFIKRRNNDKTASLIDDTLEGRNIIFETFIIVEVIEVDIGNDSYIRMIVQK
jgi:hypothetical protein